MRNAAVHVHLPMTMTQVTGGFGLRVKPTVAGTLQTVEQNVKACISINFKLGERAGQACVRVRRLNRLPVLRFIQHNKDKVPQTCV